MNWGWKLAIVYLTFAAGILTLVFKAKGERVDLVAKDYYQQELAFGQRIEASRNALALSQPVQILLEENTLVLNFPAECRDMNGNVRLYCPSNAANDKSYELTPADGLSKRINLEGVNLATYIVKVDWTMNGLNYYTEKSLMFH